jgi:DNA-binding NarL/FixJ family response regulator
MAVLLAWKKAGVSAYVGLDADDPQHIKEAILRTRPGEFHCDETTAGRLAEELLNHTRSPVLSTIQLTPREWEVSWGIVMGLSNKAMARILFISAETVKTHVLHIQRKLGTHRRGEAALIMRSLLADHGAPENPFTRYGKPG